MRVFLNFLFRAFTVIGLFLLIITNSIFSVPSITAEHYGPNDSPSSIFRVVLELYDNSREQSRFICISWDDFQLLDHNEQNEYVGGTISIPADSSSGYIPVYYADLSVTQGSCDNISSNFSVEYVDANSQLVNLRWSQETLQARNSYLVDNSEVIPQISCKLMSAEICIGIFFVSILGLPTIIIFLRFCKRKFGKLIAAGIVFTLVGLCVLNFVAYNRRMNLDHLADAAPQFMLTGKIGLMIASVLFACAAICLLINIFHRPAPQTKPLRYSRGSSLPHR